MAELKPLKKRYDNWKALVDGAGDAEALLELAVEADDEGQAGEIGDALRSLREQFEKLNVFELMSIR